MRVEFEAPLFKDDGEGENRRWTFRGARCDRLLGSYNPQQGHCK